MLGLSNISASGVIGIILLVGAFVVSMGVRRFCTHKNYDEEKTLDTVFRVKLWAMAAAIAGTVLVTEIVRF
jgi:fatty-acid desaturase